MTKKKNILLWKFADHYTRGLKDHLADDLEIKVWIDKKKFKVPTHHMDDLYKQLKFSGHSPRLNMDYQHQKTFVDIYRKVMRHTNVFMYMYSRYPALNGEHNFIDMMDAMHVYTHQFIDILTTHHIDYVFMSRIPHRGPDLILYLVAKALDIKVFMLQQTILKGKAFLATDMHEVGSLASENEDLKPEKIQQKHRNALYSISTRRRTNPYLKAFLYLFRFDLDLLLYQIMNARKSSEFKRNYTSALAGSLPRGKFVYFALHLQPELTTVSWGGEFVDQVLAIEHLRSLLPQDWSIVVKENPLQTFHSRGPLFFARLKKIPGVFYVGKDTDTFDLIEKAEFVSTVTGTVGMEALRFGKRVLVFGSAPYKEFPGVIRYSDRLTLDDILSVQFTHQEVELAHARQKSNMVDAVTTPDGAKAEDFSAEDNFQNLAEIINQATR